eukprot:COSAG02_NODE_46517_length_348_cov_0.819277_1_plen_85_part_10
MPFEMPQAQAGSEFNTPRSENNTNFMSNAQQKAATRGGQRVALQFISEFSILPTHPTHALNWWHGTMAGRAGGAPVVAGRALPLL